MLLSFMSFPLAVTASEFLRPDMSLVYTEFDGLFLYYQQNEDQVAARLLDQFPSMRDFLEKHGLALTCPLHVILDKKLDRPAPEVRMIPHREIRIPMRSPGVLEDGYLESDPWAYFFFKGLCLQGIYSERSGIQGAAYKIFGELISPNKVLPRWIQEGIDLVTAPCKRTRRHIVLHDLDAVLVLEFDSGHLVKGDDVPQSD